MPIRSLHDRVDDRFRALGNVIHAHPWRVIAFTSALTAILAGFLPTMTADFSNDSYLLPGDDTRQRFDAFRDEFGLDERTVVALEPPEVFDLEFLETLRHLHERIENEVPYVEEVLSLVNARNTYGRGDELIVEDLLENWPETPQDLATLRRNALANPTYRDALLSDDARYTVILIRSQTYSSLGESEDALEGLEENGGEDVELEYLTGQENNEMVSALYDLIAEFESEDLTIRLAGESVLGHRATAISWTDVSIFTPAALLVAMIVLFALFRRASAALLPIVVVIASVTATFGAMAAVAIPFSIPTQIIPNFLIAVGVCDAVHILTIFYQAWNRGEGKKESIVHALGHSGLAVVLTSLTTAGGLMSFLAAEITPVARLGMIGPAGVLLTLFYTLTLLPALLVVIPLSRRERVKRGGLAGAGALTSLLVRVGASVAQRPRRVLFAALVLSIIAAHGVTKVRFSHDPYGWLFPDDPVRIAVQRMDTALHGISAVEILIDTGHENGLYDPGVLKRIEAAARDALSIQDGPVPVGKAISIVDILKEINQALHANDPAHYRIPDDRALIAQELLLFENSGSDDLTQVSDSQFRTARLTLRVPLVDAFHYGAFLEDLDARMREILGPEVSVEMTGATVLGNRTFSVVITSMFRSYGLALLIITPLMIAIIGSLRVGFVSMIPNLLPVYFTLALMGWLDIPLGMSTLLLGSIVIGVAVDDTIHFLHKFDGYHRASGDSHLAIRQTMETTGTALFATSLVLMASFGSFSFGHMTGVVYFGLLAPFATLVAFVADITLSPALVVLVRSGGQRRSA